jgi:transaldolase
MYMSRFARTTALFLDSGNPQDTQELLDVGMTIDGQTTNPSLVAKALSSSVDSEEQLLEAYRQLVAKIRSYIPGKSISLEVYADKDTTAEEMIAQGKLMNAWIPDAHIKLPTIPAGLAAAEALVAEGIKVNMTLVFTEAQAAAVYVATRGAKKGDVFLSPFVGRLDDLGEDGLSLIANIQELYKKGDGHVEILMASIRSLDHFYAGLAMGVDLMTCPRKILEEWDDDGRSLPEQAPYPGRPGLAEIQKGSCSLDMPYTAYDITHPLTDAGLQKFAADWNGLIAA